MIQGPVNDETEGVIPLRLRGPKPKVLDIEAIVDTCFTASLTLSISAVRSLGLARRGRGSSELADGSTRRYDIYEADVEWDGASMKVLVYALGDQPLLGLRLLTGCELRMQVVPGGAVEIKQIP